MLQEQIIIFNVKHVKVDEPEGVEPDWDKLRLKPAKKEDREYNWKNKSFYKADISNVTYHDDKETIVSTYMGQNFFVTGSFEEVCERLYKKEEKNQEQK